MNGKSILSLVLVLGLAKMAFGGHRHRMGAGAQGRNKWEDRVAELHRELHRRDAEAGLAPAVTGAPAPAETGALAPAEA